MKTAIRIIHLILTTTAIGVLIFVLVKVMNTQILPAKYIGWGIAGVSIVSIIFILSAIFKKTPLAIRIVSAVLEIGVVIGALIGLNYLNQGTKFVETITVKEDIPEVELSVTEKPFTVFIGGVDKGEKLNDVNMIMTVNPTTGKVLLVGIPRDYYVTFHNTGEKDKLTHSAEFMGADIHNTVATVKDFMQIDLDYYIRVDFNAIEALVDVIGGIDIYSDRAFRSTTMGDCYFTKGTNHVDGHHALAFSRERKSYSGEGDLHRIENQTIVMEAVIAKLSNADIFAKYYEELLKTAAEVLKTNFREEDIYKFANFILDKKPKWEVERYRLNGTHDFHVFSPALKDYNTMIIPDEASIELAREKIKSVLSEE
jgi:LCP family protein required for cell wall assembly